MLGCNTVCPKCRHEFTCCPAATAVATCCPSRRSLHALSGGGLISTVSAVPDGPFLDKTTSAAAADFSPLSPQISPSVPLAFVLPCSRPQALPWVAAAPAAAAAAAAAAPAASAADAELRRLARSTRLLRECGWYHEGLSWQQSQALLKATAPGTFLVRDSSDARFLYSLSVQTDQGPTSVRLHYVDGKFRLDSEPYLALLMPLFDTVLDLVAHYVRCSRAAPASAGGQVWVDSKGCMFSRILLRRPLYRSERVPRLQHLARLAVHRALDASARPRLSLLPAPHTQLELPASLTDYLAQYPYSL